jgi:hypothetical protein
VFLPVAPIRRRRLFDVERVSMRGAPSARLRARRATVDSMTGELPPKPYETYLSDMLGAAMKETSSVTSVRVRGRTCTVEYGDGREPDRYLVADDTLVRALATSVGAEQGVGDVTLLPWDEDAASEPFHDGLTWIGGDVPHWCLDPDNCPDAS